MENLEQIPPSLLTDLPIYLETHSLKKLSLSSSSIHKLVNHHISLHSFFCFSPQQKQPALTRQYFKVYKPSKLHLMLSAIIKDYFLDLPNFLSYLKFSDVHYCSRAISVNFPPTLKHFSLNFPDSRPSESLLVLKEKDFLSSLYKSLPNSVSHLCITNSLNLGNKYHLPPNLTLLYLGPMQGGFGENNENLPKTLTSITFSSSFNCPVDKYLPSTLKYIKFGWSFNQPVDHLPPGLIYLYFGPDFNQTVNNLPKSLEVVEFGIYFNHSINALPLSVRYLSLECVQYSQPIDKLPPVSFLRYGDFPIPVPNLPSSLRKLVVALSGEIQFPSALSHLEFYMAFGFGKDFGSTLVFPESIRSLIMTDYCGSLDYLPKCLSFLSCETGLLDNADNLPVSLTNLRLAFMSISFLDFLPEGLIYLQLYDSLNAIDHLPFSITRLILYGTFNYPVDNLPPNLTHLKIDGPNEDIFNQSVDNLPPILKVFVINVGTFSQPLDNLPSSLQFLAIESIFHQPLDNLPGSLLYLSLLSGYTDHLDHLPLSLTHLHFDSGDRRVTVRKKFLGTLDHLPPSLFHLFCDKDGGGFSYLPSCCTLHPDYHFRDFLPANVRNFYLANYTTKNLFKI